MKRQEDKYQQKVALEQTPTLLDCPQCHSFIASDHINEKKQTAKCGHCNHVFNYETDGYWDPFGPPLDTQPEGLEVLRLSSLLELRIKHREATDRVNTLATLGFGLMWNIMLLPSYFSLLPVVSGISYCSSALHLFAGVSMLWSVLGNLFNETTVEVNQQYLLTKTTPFAWWNQRAKEIPVTDVQQLFVTRSRSKKNKGGPSYALHATLKSGKHLALISGLDQKTLQYVEREVERYLNIANTRQVV